MAPMSAQPSAGRVHRQEPNCADCLLALRNHHLTQPIAVTMRKVFYSNTIGSQSVMRSVGDGVVL